MNRINEFNIEPGPYSASDGSVLVVVDIVNHIYNASADLPEAVEDPLIILRHLDVTRLEHRRYAYPLSVFKSKFSMYPQSPVQYKICDCHYSWEKKHICHCSTSKRN